MSVEMLHVEELHFSTLHSGVLDGYPAVCVELGNDKAVAVSTLIKGVTGFAKSCIVKLYGDMHDNGNDALYAFCSSLKEQGYFLAAEIRGNDKRSWADVLSYKIALIDEQPWLMFAAQEIRYTPSKGGAISSPSLVAMHYSSYCYLVPHRDNSGEEILDFLQAHPGFRVLSTKTYRKTINLKEE